MYVYICTVTKIIYFETMNTREQHEQKRKFSPSSIPPYENNYTEQNTEYISYYTSQYVCACICVCVAYV